MTKTRLVPLVAGLLFAAGLALSEMTRPEKVIGFLAFLTPLLPPALRPSAGPAFDPSLIFVMAGAIAVHLPVVQWLRRRGAKAAQPARAHVDRRLLLGAGLFGVGWGLSGLCPGPAFVMLARPGASIVVFVAAAFVGMALAARTDRSR